MKPVLLSLLLGVSSAFAETPAPLPPEDLASLSIAEMVETADRQHPVVLYTLAARLLGDGQEQEAANWMYVAQLRYRFLNAVSETGKTSSCSRRSMRGLADR